MAGLLDFALGFGQGAAGAVAYDRKSQLDMQRQANLERLRAQYANQLKTEQVDATADLIGLAREGDQDAIDRLMAQGVDLTEATSDAKFQNYIDPEGNPVVIDENNPADAARIRDESLVKGGVASVDREGSGTRNNYVNTVTGDRGLFTDDDPKLDEPGWQKVGAFEQQGGFTERTDSAGREYRTDPVTGRTERWNVAQERWENISGEGEASPSEQQLPWPSIPATSQPGDRVEQISNVNPISNTPGIRAGAVRAIGNFTIVGDILNEYTQARTGENFGSKEAQGRFMMDSLANRLRAAAARNIQDDGGRLSNMILELTKSETISSGLFTSENGLANQIKSAVGELESRYQRELDVLNNPSLNPERIIQAQNFVEEFSPVIRDMSIMVNTHNLASTTIEGRRFIELSPEEISSVVDRASAGDINLSQPQIDAIASFYALDIFNSQNSGRR